MGSSPNDFSVVVLPSDYGIDSRPFLTNQQQQRVVAEEDEDQENWHDCPQILSSDEDFSDLELLQFFRPQGRDKSGNLIFRIVGKYFPGIDMIPSRLGSLLGCLQTGDGEEKRFEGENGVIHRIAPVVSGDRLKRYICNKLCSDSPEGPYCIVYMHSTVQKEDNSPGITILRWIYEELPSHLKDRLQVVYFIHPGLRSRLVFATLGRFFLSGGLYWKIKYVSRLQYLWDDIKKGEIEIPDFVKSHDDVLEHRPLTDYGIEPDPLHMIEVPATAYSFGRYEERWASREYTS